MKMALIGLGAAVAVIAIPVAASAYPARVVATVNLRTCGSTACPVITVLNPGAAVDVRGYANGWDYLVYGGYAGYAAANYIAAGGYVRPPVAVPPPIVRAYPVYPAPYFYGMPGFSLNFNFGIGNRHDRRH
jgi:uncharacterized protein YraI